MLELVLSLKNMDQFDKIYMISNKHCLHRKYIVAI